MMHGHEKSRSAIVAGKPTNKAERSAAEQSAAEPTAAEPVERRAETKGNADQQRTRRTQRRISVSKMLARIRQRIVAVDTQGGNRMRESCTYGSVRGARGNSRPYRERCFLLRCRGLQLALGVFHCGAQNSDAIGGTADIDWSPAPIASEAYDPSATSPGRYCCAAQHGPFGLNAVVEFGLSA